MFKLVSELYYGFLRLRYGFTMNYICFLLVGETPLEAVFATLSDSLWQLTPSVICCHAISFLCRAAAVN